MMRTVVLLTALAVPSQFAVADDADTIHLAGTPEQWEAMEQAMHAEKERLKEEVAASIAAGNPEETHVEMLERWSEDQARKLVDALEKLD